MPKKQASTWGLCAIGLHMTTFSALPAALPLARPLARPRLEANENQQEVNMASLSRSLGTTALTAALTASLVASGARPERGRSSSAPNWLAQAEHGGFYQSVADGTYAACGLDVTIHAGRPAGEQPRADAGGQDRLQHGRQPARGVQRRAGRRAGRRRRRLVPEGTAGDPDPSRARPSRSKTSRTCRCC